jgi:predicted permease
MGYFFEDKPLAPGALPPHTQFRYTSPGFLETLGAPLLAGRAFEWADHHERHRVALVSASMARRHWGTPEAALGKRLRSTEAAPWGEIVGVVGDVHDEGLDRPASDTVYLTAADRLVPYIIRTVSFVIRSERVGTAGFLEDVQQAVWSVNADLPLASVQTLEDVHRRSLERTSLTLVLMAIIGGMALLLGVVGIYGVLSCALSQRTREIGIRIALGAQNSTVQRLFFRQGLSVVAVGAAIGLAGAAALTRLMASLLFGVTPLDPATYAAGTVLLVAAAALASYLPVRRATRIDPIEALRYE